MNTSQSLALEFMSQGHWVCLQLADYRRSIGKLARMIIGLSCNKDISQAFVNSSQKKYKTVTSKSERYGSNHNLKDNGFGSFCNIENILLQPTPDMHFFILHV